jgi:GT2 family glycosyltransferase/glycosyltransferase involved in cell wall biosynthesis
VRNLPKNLIPSRDEKMPNIRLRSKLISAQQQVVSSHSVAVCGCELAHNPAGRVITLAQLYATSFDVEIIGCIFPQWGEQLWEPVRETIFPKHILTVRDESHFLKHATELVTAHPYATVHLCKPRIVNILIGLLYKVIWGANILIDIDDEELAFVGADSPLDLDEYLSRYGCLPKLIDLTKNVWTRLAVGLVDSFDAITVSNAALQRRYGGTVIAHARDEKIFTVSPPRKRTCRERFGVPQDARVVLFLGTPRAHKGLLETAQSIAALNRDDVLFLIAGDFEDDSLKQALLAIHGVRFHFLGNQPFSLLHEVVALGDVCVLFQDVHALVSQFQMPAKLSDALGMGLAVLATRTPPLEQAFAAGALLPVTHDTLTSQLEAALDNTPAADAARKAGINWFKSELSLSVNARKLRDCLTSLSPRPCWFGIFTKMRSLFPGELQGLAAYRFARSVKLFHGTNHPRIAFVVHVDHPDSWTGISSRLCALSSRFSLFVTTSHTEADKIEERVHKDIVDAVIKSFPGREADMLAFLSVLPDLIAGQYDAACMLCPDHETKTNTKSLGAGSVLENLVTNDNAIYTIGNAFVYDPDLMLAGAGPFFLSSSSLLDKGPEKLFSLFDPTDTKPRQTPNRGWFAQGSFWFRPSALKKMIGKAEHILSCLRHDSFSTIHNIPVLSLMIGDIASVDKKHIGLLHQSRHDHHGPALQIIADPALGSNRAQGWQVVQQLESLAGDHALLDDCGLFDASYYMSHQPGLLGIGIDPVIHYLLIGRFQGIRPCPDFDSSWYCTHHADKIGAKTDALVHYLRQGAKEDLAIQKSHGRQQKDLFGFRFKALNSVLVDWRKQDALKRDPDLVSIVVPVFNQPEMTTACVQSLFSCAPSTPFELILVDNGSNQATRSLLDELARTYRRITVLHNEENLNFALGCNIGFAASTGGRIIFLNNDTTVTPGFIKPLVTSLERENIAAVQPLLLYPDGLVQCMGVVFSNRSVLGYPLYANMKPEKKWTNRSRALQAVTGACMAVRAGDFARARGFDPVFVNGQEDIDLCLRLTRYKRRTCWYESTSCVYHHESRTKNRHTFNEQNRRRFIRRWRGAVVPDDTQHYETDGFTVVSYHADKKKNIELSTWRPRLKK